MRIIFLNNFERLNWLKMVALLDLNAFMRVIGEGRGRLE